MAEFCNSCGTYLVFSTNKGDLILKCNNCQIEKKIERTIISEYQGTHERYKKKRLYFSILQDEIMYPNIKKIIKTHNCGNHILRYAKNYATMKNFYVCPQCGKHT
jgi:DNA-directed RNA polymerase subunit M/transcription elongation factor TFIIS